MRAVRLRCLPVLAVLTVLTVLLGSAPALTQERPSFEVASVRPAPPPQGPFLRTSSLRFRSDRFEATATLRVLIHSAFEPAFPIEGSFRELEDWFEIQAKAAGPVLRAPPGEVGPANQMLQSLLEERFKLRVRWETRPFEVFALRRTTTEQLGHNVKRLDVTCPPGYPETISAAPQGCMSLMRTDKGQIQAFGRMSDFARMISMFAGRRIVDDTGLAGRFELSTAFNPRSDTDFGLPAQEHLPSLRDALRDDLGLKLEPERRDFPVLIVEHVEQPTAN